MNISKSAIITAGGTSNRFGGDKLLETIETEGKKQSVILTTLEKFLNLFDVVVIPCREGVLEHIKNSPLYNPNKIIFAPPGETRQKSVFNGLLRLEEFSPEIVLIHDGARPFIEEKTILETIEKLKVYKGVCVGVYAVDTIKITDKDGLIIKTVDRKTVFQAQTPQGFDFKTIFEAHKKLQNENFTDDSIMLEAVGVPVFALCGSVLNKKITFREDLQN